MTSDSLYHRLFSHPLMVEHLVREFVPEAMAAGLDFSRMERVNAKFHASTGSSREGDVIWRIPTRNGGEIYLYILLEFQSTVDWWMVVHSVVYVGLLWQQIIKERRLKRGDTVPPVLPLVLYNGDARWNAPEDLSDLITLPPDSSLWPWQPRMRYYLVDEGAFPGEELARRESLVALLFQLETCAEPKDLLAAVDGVIAWFRSHPGYETLKRVFTELVHQAGRKDSTIPLPLPDDLLEIRTMLASKVEQWQQRWKAEGKADVLLRQLDRRWGAVPPEIESRVRAAESSQLDEWLNRLMEGRTLAEVFEPPSTH
ncbi:MAG: transposase [Rhodospirillaceae bacterium]|nr:MAG: transposase [Rhodospirillaceae bacterium]